MSEDTFYVSNKVCIVDGEKNVLLLQNPNESWELPGGHVHHGEDPGEALNREVLEETSCSLHDVVLVTSYSHEDIITLFWRGRIRGDVSVSDEHIDAAWVAESQLESVDVKHGDALRDVIRELLPA